MYELIIPDNNNKANGVDNKLSLLLSKENSKVALRTDLDDVESIAELSEILVKQADNIDVLNYRKPVTGETQIDTYFSLEQKKIGTHC